MIRALFAVAVMASVSSAYAAPVPAGLWSTPKDKAQVRIAACGDSLCATLAGLKKPNDRDGRPKRDVRNPNLALRDRPVVGVSLVSDMRPDGDAWSGTVYNPDDGRTYSGRIVVDGADRLQLQGCVAGVLCKTQVLRRLR